MLILNRGGVLVTTSRWHQKKFRLIRTFCGGLPRTAPKQPLCHGILPFTIGEPGFDDIPEEGISPTRLVASLIKDQRSECLS